jgi:hypothetical protein
MLIYMYACTHGCSCMYACACSYTCMFARMDAHVCMLVHACPSSYMMHMCIHLENSSIHMHVCMAGTTLTCMYCMSGNDIYACMRSPWHVRGCHTNGMVGRHPICARTPPRTHPFIPHAIHACCHELHAYTVACMRGSEVRNHRHGRIWTHAMSLPEPMDVYSAHKHQKQEHKSIAWAISIGQKAGGIQNCVFHRAKTADIRNCVFSSSSSSFSSILRQSGRWGECWQ